MAVEIPLTKGYVALVDEIDAERVLAYRWRAVDTKRGLVYAATGSDPFISLHRFILGVGPRRPIVDHRNYNGLDNQRHNLRVATQSQNCMNRDPERAKKRNRLGFFGIYQQCGTFRGRVYKNKVEYRTAKCPTPFEAAIARDTLAVELFGEFAPLNLPHLRSP